LRLDELPLESIERGEVRYCFVPTALVARLSPVFGAAVCGALCSSVGGGGGGGGGGGAAAGADEPPPKHIAILLTYFFVVLDGANGGV